MSISIPIAAGTKPFCEVSSEDPNSSNLQLFSLSQAFRFYRIFQRIKPTISAPQQTEYLIFIIICLGTSISQLLGQNASTPQSGTHIGTPKQLFDQIFGGSHPKRNNFLHFIDIYDACRHFGSPKHRVLNSLTAPDCDAFLDLIVDLWDELVHTYIASGKDTNGQLSGFNSVRDFV